MELLLASVSILYRAIEYIRLRFPDEINKPISIAKNALEEHSSHRQSTWGSVRIKEYLILTSSHSIIYVYPFATCRPESDLLTASYYYSAAYSRMAYYLSLLPVPPPTYDSYIMYI